MTDSVLPENARFIGDDITEGDFKVAFVEMLDYLREQFGDNGAISDLINNLAAVAKSGSYNDLKDKPNLAAVATSGSYNDLANKPSIPTNYVAKDNGSQAIGSFILGYYHTYNPSSVGNGGIVTNSHIFSAKLNNKDNDFTAGTYSGTCPGSWRNVSGHTIERYCIGIFQRVA